MVLVFVLTATALGAAPTRMVAMTLITPGAGGAAVGAGDVAAAVAVAAPVTVSKAVAADKTACRVSLMTSFFLDQRRASSRDIVPHDAADSATNSPRPRGADSPVIS